MCEVSPCNRFFSISISLNEREEWRRTQPPTLCAKFKISRMRKVRVHVTARNDNRSSNANFVCTGATRNDSNNRKTLLYQVYTGWCAVNELSMAPDHLTAAYGVHTQLFPLAYARSFREDSIVVHSLSQDKGPSGQADVFFLSRPHCTNETKKKAGNLRTSEICDHLIFDRILSARDIDVSLRLVMRR